MIYHPLEIDKWLINASETTKRIILFDPTEAYKRIIIDKFSRYQKIGMDVLFPTIESGVCACGCNAKLEGRRRRWATNDCQTFVQGVFLIIRGDGDYIKRLMRFYLPEQCCDCQRPQYTIETRKEKIYKHNGRTYEDVNWFAGVHVEHILAVKNGGGGCWLNNYQFMCSDCHRQKSPLDRALRNRVKQLPPSNEFN